MPIKFIEEEPKSTIKFLEEKPKTSIRFVDNDIGEIKEYKPTIKDHIRNWLLGFQLNKESIPPVEIVKRTLLEKREDPKEEVARQYLSNLINSVGFNIPSVLFEKLGIEMPEPKTPAERIGAGLGQLTGFVKGPLKASGKIAPKIPVVSRAFKPAATMTQAVTKPLVRGAATLGTASGLMSPEKSLFSPEERLKQFGEGAKTGAMFGAISFIPNTAARMITSSAYIGVPSTLREDPMEEQVFNYGLGAWMGRSGGSPKEIFKREKPLVNLIQEGTDNYQKFFEEADRLLKQERTLALETGKEPISREQKFSQVASKRTTSGLLEVAKETLIGNPKNWKRNVVKNIRNRVIELKRSPQFQLETGDIDFTVEYLTKDLGLKVSELNKLDNATLSSISKQLNSYQLGTKTPFVTPPPLKPVYANRDWSKKINPWDVTLRGGLKKLEKLGFGDITQEGLTEKFFVSGAEKSQFMSRYMELRNNWMRITGMNKQRSNDIFEYLDGKVHPDYLKGIHGEKTLKVANQMREFLDTLLVHQNRHRAMYGEEPIKPRKNYVTHLFEDFLKEIQAKKHPFPDWLADAMPYIIPQKKSSPFLKERKGVKGYQKDVWKALDTYTYKAAQVVGDEPIRRAYKVNRFLQKQIDQEKNTGKITEVDWKGIRSNLNDYTKDLQGRPGKIDETLRGLVDPLNSVLSKLPGQVQIKSLNDISDGMVSLLYGSQMAYRPKLPIRNLGQHSLIIGQTGFKPLGWAIKNRNTKEAREILKNSKLLASRQRAFGAETQALFGKGTVQKISEIGLKPYRQADIINVEDAYLAGYKYAKDKGMSDVKAFKKADQVSALTQYIYLPENRSDLARGFRLSKTLGRPLSVFTTWPSNWIEFQISSASNPETRTNLLKYWATALAFTGVSALAGIKGAEYTGISSPSSLLNIFRGELPIVGVSERLNVQAVDEFRAWVDGDKDLKDILFYTFK